ncbi:hypothetical protein [Sphaerisporangium corydalis]|uniref:ABC transporter permease n=1 Tax=Sphaerisporangium corydalis TaxID=1441875 RepID=A0ABV9ED20_9ACTN|nr:hypothetical protein [Sphaerisporangium corydalis]
MTSRSAARARGARAPGERPGFGDVLWSEWTKVRTLRSTWYTLVAIVAVAALFGAMFAGGGAREYAEMTAAERAGFDPFASVFRALLFVEVLVGYLGLRAVTVEYGTGTMPVSVTAVPGRGRLLAAKGVVCAGMALTAGWLAGLAVYLTGRLVLVAQDAPVYALGQPGVVRALVGVGLVMATMSLLGLAAGLLVRTTAGALTIVVMIVLLIPALSPLFPEWPARFVLTYWPTMAGGRLAAPRIDPDVLAPWTGYALFCGYVAVFLLGTYAMFRRRDA